MGLGLLLVGILFNGVEGVFAEKGWTNELDVGSILSPPQLLYPKDVLIAVLQLGAFWEQRAKILE